jgi:hypothetical protein
MDRLDYYSEPDHYKKLIASIGGYLFAFCRLQVLIANSNCDIFDRYCVDVQYRVQYIGKTG